LISYRVEHAGEDFEAQVLFVTETVTAPLDDPDLVVHALDESQRKEKGVGSLFYRRKGGHISQ
ncbi:MAG: hypothetical protein ABI988_12035, partial [Nitrospirota bacterium]